MSLGPYGDELYQQVLPLHGPDPDGLARDYIGAVSSQAVEIDDLVRDDAQGRPGWGVILDVDAAPPKGLPWLGQIAGVQLRDPKMVTLYNLANYSLPQNGSFEQSDLSAWAYPNTAISRVIGGTAGNYMLHGRATANATVGIQFTVDTGENARTTWAIDVLACSRAVALQIEFQDSGFGTLSTITDTASSAVGRRSLTAVSPAGTEYTTYRLVMASALTNETFDVDAAAIISAASIIAPDGPTGAGVSTSDYFDGFTLTRLETDDEWATYARDAIQRQGGKGRGTPDAILSAAEDTLTGQRVARLVERVGGEAYALDLITRPSETPNPDATLLAARSQKPIGMGLAHILTEDRIIDEDTGTIDTAGGTIDVPA